MLALFYYMELISTFFIQTNCSDLLTIQYNKLQKQFAETTS